MAELHVHFDLGDLVEALDGAMGIADAHDFETVRINRSTWVMARSLCDEVARLRGGNPVIGGIGDSPSLEELGFTHVARCVECDHEIFKHPTWAHFGGGGKSNDDFDHKAAARLGTIEPWPKAKG